MRVIKKNLKSYVMALSLCITLSGLLVVTNSQPTQAKSLPETLVDLLTGQKDVPANTTTKEKPSAAPVVATPSVAPSSQPSQSVTKPVQSTAATAPALATSSSADQKTQPAAVNPVDTSVQVRQIAAAQAIRTNIPSRYESSKIASSQRNDLYRISVIALASGAVLYLFSFTHARQWFYKNTVASSKTVTQ